MGLLDIDTGEKKEKIRFVVNAFGVFLLPHLALSISSPTPRSFSYVLKVRHWEKQISNSFTNFGFDG